jgi:hypothetical protein
MRRVARWTLLFAWVCAAGCGAWKRPYARDPLLRDGRGVWGDAAKTRAPGPAPAPGPEPEPDAPRPPEPAVVLAAGSDVTDSK